NALWIIVAGLCAFAISYRFYSKWLATKVLLLNDERATPALVQNDGKDFVPTNRWMVFGHHFAAIAGPGPLVGPVLAAQFGFLPGTLWILIGATLGGGVHDMIVLFASVRRRGKTLGQMVKEEIGRGVGALALISVLAIMIILLAGLGDYGLRLGGVDSAGVDVTDAARLSQHVFENRHGRRPRGGSRVDSPGAANARADKIHRWKRTSFRRARFSICLHYHRMR